MINLISAINWVGVLVAFFAYFFLAACWFMFLFKKQYLISLGRENDAPQKPSPIFIIGPAICSLIVTITSAILMSALGIDSYGKAIEFALVVGIGYLFANTVNIGINPNIPKPVLYGAISGTCQLVGMLIVSVIIVAMN
jgi:hypothetical protein